MARESKNARKREEPGRVVRLAVVVGDEATNYPRPKTRGECEDMPRPCPFVACRYHLAFDVMPGGIIRVNFPDLVSVESDGPLELGKLPASCALDVADRNGQESEQVADLLNLSREAERKIEIRIYRRIGKVLRPHAG